MSHRHLLLSALVSAGAVGAPLPCAQAAAPIGVGPQRIQHGGTFPVTIAGQRPPVRAGQRLGAGQILLSREVILAHGARVQLELTCPSGTNDRGIGVGNGTQIGFAVTDTHHYVGSRAVAVTATSRVHADAVGHGTVYAICS
jgi:hypothetical protein